MSILSGQSPDLEFAQLTAANAPPTPPHEDPLDDIYGSAPSSPALLSQPNFGQERSHEILSDLPSRQRALDTDAYREGLSNSKGKYVQEGFDEGYSLGANLGLKVGYVFGILQGLTSAWKLQNTAEYQRVDTIFKAAKVELAIQDLLGQQWVNEEGIWKWDVAGKEEDPTFREIAQQHPVVQKWMSKVEDLATKCGIDLEAVDKHHASTPGEQA